MFNFRNKEEKKYKGSTIYVMKHEDANVEDLLAIIVRNIERYVEGMV